MEFVKFFGPYGMFFVMFSIALSLTAADFKQVFTKPKALLVGLLCQMLLIPCLGFVLIIIFYDLPVNIKTSVLLLTILPTAVMSNYMAKKADANIPLSISMTAVGCGLAFIKVPLFFYLISNILLPDAGIVFPKINLAQVSLALLIIVTLPVILGIAFATKFSTFAKKIDPICDRISMLIFLVIVFGGIFEERHELLGYFQISGIISVILLAAIFFMAVSVTEVMQLRQIDRRAILIECILQNGAIGFVIGALMFDEVQYLIPIATYAIIQYLFLIVYFLIRRS